jgi:nitrogen fixation protein
MIAFSERAWCGGGFNVFDANIKGPASDRYEAFSNFERKLIEHKKRYFNGLSFPYQKQSDIEWKMMGPFNNKGDVNTTFTPEMPGYFDTLDIKRLPAVWGGTIWLRHFWDPVIKSHFNNLDDSTTWYAYRKIFADAAGTYPFWIGFNNISRSHKAPTPPSGQWDDKGSRVWVNGTEVSPPSWKYAGRIPKDLEEPLYDEGYEYREPTNIHLNKGWNEVLLKLPVRSFRSPNEIPVKWMFTFVQVLDQANHK